jgi:NitT/TauT family transport system permease protein
VRRRIILISAQLVCAVAFLFAWQWASSNGHVSSFEFGKPSAVYDQLVEWWHDGTLRDASISTTEVLLLGWGIGTFIGMAVGVLTGVSKFANDVLEPFLDFFNALPRLILQPFIVIWLGFGLPAKVTFVVIVIWVITALSISEGSRHIPKEIIQQAQILGAGKARVLRDVYAPSLALWVVASSRTTFGFAFQAAVLAEFVGTNQGLGNLVIVAQNAFQINAIYAALAVVMVIAIFGNVLLSAAETRATRWMPAPQ